LADNRTAGHHRPLFYHHHPVDDSVRAEITIFEMRPAHDADVFADCTIFIEYRTFDMAIRSDAHTGQTLFRQRVDVRQRLVTIGAHHVRILHGYTGANARPDSDYRTDDVLRSDHTPVGNYSVLEVGACNF